MISKKYLKTNLHGSTIWIRLFNQLTNYFTFGITSLSHQHTSSRNSKSIKKSLNRITAGFLDTHVDRPDGASESPFYETFYDTRRKSTWEQRRNFREGDASASPPTSSPCRTCSRCKAVVGWRWKDLRRKNLKAKLEESVSHLLCSKDALMA